MIYRFILLSNEKDDFKREIQINAKATFEEFHHAIQASVGYDNKQLSSFFICNEHWEKQTEVTLIEMEDTLDKPTYVMDVTRLDELVKGKGQRLLYVFDLLLDRAFFIDLCEVIPMKKLKKPVCLLSEGEAPIQQINDGDLNGALDEPNLDMDGLYDDLDDDLLSNGFENIEDLETDF